MDNEAQVNQVKIGKKPNQVFNLLLNKISNVLARRIIGCAVIFIVILITCLLCSFFIKFIAGKTKQNLSDSLPFSNTAQETKEDQKFDKPKKISQSVIVGAVEWKLLEAKDLGSEIKTDRDDDYCKADEGNKFIYIKFSIKNIDRAFVTLPVNEEHIYDNNEDKFPVSTKSMICLGVKEPGIKEKYIPKILNRDDKETIEEIFEVPSSSKNFKLKAGDLSLTGKDFEYISLGI